MDCESSAIDAISVLVVDLQRITIDVDFYQIIGRHLVKKNAISIDEELIFGVRHPRVASDATGLDDNDDIPDERKQESIFNKSHFTANHTINQFSWSLFCGQHPRF